MTVFEVAVLRAFVRSSSPLGWYGVERSLSCVVLPERPRVPPVLASLQQRGLLEEVVPAAPGTSAQYRITPAGRAAVGEGERE